MSATEKHYTVREIAAMWGMSQSRVRRLFKDEVDLLPLVNPETRSKRGYTTLYVPESTLQRVYQRLQKQPPKRF